MRRHILLITTLAAVLLSVASPARGQSIEPQHFLLRCPASATPPTHTEGVASLCSQTLGGRVRVDTGMLDFATHDEQSLQTTALGQLITLLSNPLTFNLNNGSRTATENGNVTGGQLSTAVVVSFPYVFDGTNWVRSYGSYSTGWSLAAVLAAQIKGSVGVVYGIQCFNNDTTKKFIRLYNQVGAPANTDTANIIWRGLVPAEGAGNGGGFAIPFKDGKLFSTGIGIRITDGVADNDATPLGTNDIACNVDFR